MFTRRPPALPERPFPLVLRAEWRCDRMAPVRAVCADCANGRKALPYGMRFSCFTDGDLHRR